MKKCRIGQILQHHFIKGVDERLANGRAMGSAAMEHPLDVRADSMRPRKSVKDHEEDEAAEHNQLTEIINSLDFVKVFNAQQADSKVDSCSQCAPDGLTVQEGQLEEIVEVVLFLILRIVGRVSIHLANLAEFDQLEKLLPFSCSIPNATRHGLEIVVDCCKFEFETIDHPIIIRTALNRRFGWMPITSNDKASNQQCKGHSIGQWTVDIDAKCSLMGVVKVVKAAPIGKYRLQFGQNVSGTIQMRRNEAASIMTFHWGAEIEH
jgi:hypothetical protein